MNEWRCEGCGKLLGLFRVEPQGSIKCQRCGHLNVLPQPVEATKSTRPRLVAVGDTRIGGTNDGDR